MADRHAAGAGDSFLRYSEWYDAFYRDKDYQAEAGFVFREVSAHANPRSWLDVGCGTGKHLGCLAGMGLRVAGVDPSAKMIAQAREAYPDIPFERADAAGFSLPARFDAASLLFHVINYMTDDAQVVASLRNIRRHLAANGMLIFDFWHSGGVLHDPPRVTLKSRIVNGRPLHRIARPEEDRDAHRVRVHYEFRLDDEDGKVIHSETHDIRHFSVPELTDHLRAAGLELLDAQGWMTGAPLGAQEWFGLVLARSEK